jgi:nitric oxide reductase subunit B
MLMVVLDLLPAGILQFQEVVENGLWFARSEQFIGGGVFKSLTWLRGIGACLFLFAGVIPLVYFMGSRAKSLKSGSNSVTILDDEQ